MIRRLLPQAFWPVLALVGTLAPAPAAASLPNWPDRHLLAAELKGETLLPAGSEVEVAAPHVHGAFCPHALRGPKTRVRGFDLGLHCYIGGDAGLTCAARPAYAISSADTASDRGYNAKARYFDPQLGRFLTQDSYLGQIDEPPSLHRYFYAHANPTAFVDPTGHIAILKELQDKVDSLREGVLKSTGKISKLIEEKTGIKSRTLDDKLADVTGAVATGLGLSSTAVGVLNQAANAGVLSAAPYSSLGLDVIQEMAQDLQAMAGAARQVVENPKGVALQIIDEGKKTAVAAMSGDPEAMARVKAGAAEFVVDVAIGGKGAKTALSASRRLVGLTDDLAEGAAGLARRSEQVLDKVKDVADAAPNRGLGQHGVNLLEPKQLQPAPAGVRFGPPRGGGGSAADRAYASRVTGGADKSVYVNGTEFDSVRGGILIDAKRASGSGSFYDISGGDRFTQNVKIPEIVGQAQRQVNAAGGQGFKGIRWEIADPNVAQQLQTLFTQRGIRIQVVHTSGN